MKDNSPLVRATIEYIDANLRATLSEKEIAAAMKTDPADLDRIFRQATGKTIKRYIDEQSKKKLENRLKDGNCKGYQIAQELGFNSDQAFYRWVKRVYSIPFRELKERYCGKRGERRGGG